MRLRARACLVAIGVLTLVMTVGGTVRAQQAPRAPQPAAGAAQAIESGKATWAKLACSTCHGPDAAGTAAAPKLAMTMLALPAFTGYVRKPTGTMPPQGEQMVSDREQRRGRRRAVQEERLL
jgi:mono/diheme cytochrome c family protein